MTDKKFFRDGLVRETPDGPVLLANRCAACDKVYFPKVDFCPRCLAEQLEERELSRKGRLHSYTVTRVPMERFVPPHPHGIVLLPDDKVSIITPLVLGEGEELAIGTEMEVVVAPLWLDEEGEPVYGYKFQKSGGGER